MVRGLGFKVMSLGLRVRGPYHGGGVAEEHKVVVVVGLTHDKNVRKGEAL